MEVGQFYLAINGPPAAITSAIDKTELHVGILRHPEVGMTYSCVEEKSRFLIQRDQPCPQLNRDKLFIMNRFNQNREGFSLLELLAVVTILGLLAALILPRVSQNSLNAKYKTCFHNRATINSAVDRYFVEKGVWPANDLSDIGADTDYFPEGIPTCPATDSAYDLDPTTRRIIGHKGSEGKGALDHL